MVDRATCRRVTKRPRENHVVIDDPKELSAMFASMVTVPAADYFWIARNGEESLFKVLQKMMPKVRSKSHKITSLVEISIEAAILFVPNQNPMSGLNFTLHVHTECWKT